MSDQYRCKQCGYVLDMAELQCSECDDGHFERLNWTKGGNGSHWDGCDEVHWDCKIAKLEKELASRDEFVVLLTTAFQEVLKEAITHDLMWCGLGNEKTVLDKFNRIAESALSRVEDRLHLPKDEK